jgi:hypothetical protein
MSSITLGVSVAIFSLDNLVKSVALKTPTQFKFRAQAGPNSCCICCGFQCHTFLGEIVLALVK